MDPELLERVTARRAELDELEEQLPRRKCGPSGTNPPSPTGLLSG
ncbi:hypothetical protein [Streptomyces syringium]